MLCCWLFFVIPMNWFINGGILETKAGFLGDGTKIWVKFWEMISEIMSKIHHRCYQYIGSKRVRKTWRKNLLVTWIVFRTLSSLFVFWYMSSQAVEKRKETLALCYLLYIHRHFMLQDQDSNAHMAYWLSNTYVLLFLLQRTLKATGGKPPTPTSFFGRMTQRNNCTITTNGDLIDKIFYCIMLEVYQVEAKYPALLFKQQCTTYVEKIYGIVQDNSKKDLSPLLSSCIQGCCNSKSQRETCQRDHSTVMQRSLNFRLRCLGLWTSLSTHFTTIKISSLENIFGMVVNIFVYGGHVLF
ncbi:hypothetical protein ACSBR2_034369 [Camellia fascicularis]